MKRSALSTCHWFSENSCSHVSQCHSRGAFHFARLRLFSPVMSRFVVFLESRNFNLDLHVYYLYVLFLFPYLFLSLSPLAGAAISRLFNFAATRYATEKKTSTATTREFRVVFPSARFTPFPPLLPFLFDPHRRRGRTYPHDRRPLLLCHRFSCDRLAIASTSSIVLREYIAIFLG